MDNRIVKDDGAFDVTGAMKPVQKAIDTAVNIIKDNLEQSATAPLQDSGEVEQSITGEPKTPETGQNKPNKPSENTDETLIKPTKPWYFKKGDDPRRNLKGNPGSKRMTTLVKEIFATVEYKTEDGKMIAADRAIARRLVDKAAKGNDRSIEQVFAYIDGKPKETVEINHVDITPEAQELADRAIDEYLESIGINPKKDVNDSANS